MRARECEWCDRPEIELRLRILGNTRSGGYATAATNPRWEIRQDRRHRLRVSMPHETVMYTGERRRNDTNAL